MEKELTKGRFRSWVLMIFVGCVASSIITFWLVSVRDYRESDFFIYWLSSRLLSIGLDPYNQSHWISGNQLFGTPLRIETGLTYPLPLAIIFLPFGLLTLKYASAIWIFSTTMLAYISSLILIRYSKLINKAVFFIPLFLGISLFRPFVTTLFTGQLAGLFLFIIILSAVLILLGKWNLGVLFLPLLLLKPQIGIPFMTLVIFWFVIEKKWGALLYQMVITSSIIGLTFIVDGDWFTKWLGVGKTALDIVIGQSPTLWGAAHFLCKGNTLCWFPLASCIVGLFIGFCLLIIIRHPTSDPCLSFSFFTCIVLLTTPYLLASDQLLLLLPVLYATTTISNLNIPHKYLASSLPILFLSIISYLVIYLSQQYSTDAFSVIVTLLALMILAASQIFVHTNIAKLPSSHKIKPVET